MKKSDLKTGMLIQQRSGEIKLIINGHLINDTEWGSLYNYKEDLTSIFDSINDIMKVSNIVENADLMPSNWERALYDNLLWYRSEENETIRIGRYEYDKKEVEERLRDIEPLNK